MRYDIAFVGHMCFDEIQPFGGETRVAPGSAVLCGALTAARIGKKVAAVVRMSESDDAILGAMRGAGIGVYAVPSAETTYMQVIHPSEDVEDRRLIMAKNAGFFETQDFPRIDAEYVHLAGISDREFNMEFMRGLKSLGYRLSADMQSFVRQAAGPSGGEISFSDAADKIEIAGLMERLKLDVTEAKILTGTGDLEKAARFFGGCGVSEVMITETGGVLLLSGNETFYSAFTNRSSIGRTGRGDTTFAAYLCRRMDYPPKEALDFAAALVSIKMETPGPFAGTLEDVLERMG